MKLNTDSGFTIIEIVAVLLVIGVITAFAIGRSADHNTELIVQTEILKARLRYAQSMSMKSNMVYSIQFDTNGYALNKYDPSPPGSIESLSFPGEESNQVVLSGRDLEIPAGTVGTVVSFNSKGIPCTDSEGETPLPGPDPLMVSITRLNAGDDGSQTISGPGIAIQPNTGFIP